MRRHACSPLRIFVAAASALLAILATEQTSIAAPFTWNVSYAGTNLSLQGFITFSDVSGPPGTIADLDISGLLFTHPFSATEADIDFSVFEQADTSPIFIIDFGLIFSTDGLIGVNFLSLDENSASATCASAKDAGVECGDEVVATASANLTALTPGVTVPQPAPLALLVAGLVAGAFLLSRRRRAQGGR